MPGIAFNSLLNQSVQIGLAAMSAKVGGKSENPCSPPLITLMAAPVNHPTSGHRAEAMHVLNKCLLIILEWAMGGSNACLDNCYVISLMSHDWKQCRHEMIACRDTE